MFNQIISNPQKKSWASFIKSELDNLGLSNLSNGSIPIFSIIKPSVRHQYLQKWSASLSSMSKLESYNRYKKTFTMEKYLQILRNDTLRKHLSPFRLVSHRLENEMGRHITIFPGNKGSAKYVICNRQNQNIISCIMYSI